MKLSEAPAHVSLNVVHVKAESSVLKRLAALGIASGCEISLFSNQRGAVVALVKDSRLALDKTISSNIEVEIKEVNQ